MKRDDFVPEGDRLGMALRQFNELPPFPDGVNTWSEFVRRCNSSEVSGQPFFITLRSRPRRETLYEAWQRKDEHYFGILQVTKDGRLGCMCFGIDSNETNPTYNPAHPGIFIRTEGFDPKFLRVATVPNFNDENMRKIVGCEYQSRSVFALLVPVIKQLVGPDDKAVPDAIAAAKLAKAKHHIRTFLEKCKGQGNADDVHLALSQIQKRVDYRVKQLEISRQRHLEDIISLEGEMGNLQGLEDLNRSLQLPLF